jgi:hypothetical protein
MTDDLLTKRSQANGLLDDFKLWHQYGTNSNLMIVMIGLRRDILTGDHKTLDHLITSLTDRNNAAMLAKMSENNG